MSGNIIAQAETKGCIVKLCDLARSKWWQNFNFFTSFNYKTLKWNPALPVQVKMQNMKASKAICQNTYLSILETKKDWNCHKSSIA